MTEQTTQRARSLHLTLLGSTLLYLIFLDTLDYIQMLPLAPFDDVVLTVLIVILGGAGVITVGLTPFLPRLMARQQPHPPGLLLKIHLLRGIILESVAVYGLVLGLAGAGWAVVLPFFVVSSVAFLLTFPRAERNDVIGTE